MAQRARDLRRVLARRRFLRRQFDLTREFERLEESCVPSYCHRNPAAAAVSWLRLLRAAALYREWCVDGPVLDFGAGTGEVAHLLGAGADYHFIEMNQCLLSCLQESLPGAVRADLETLPPRSFQTIFALDSREHNESFALLLERLVGSLRRDGMFILRGPAETWVYRLGRKSAGFSGHYHKTTITDIERVASGCLQLCDVHRVPFGMPLFRVSIWKTTP